jgi:hypothetical protein
MARQEQQDMGTVDNGFSADGENSVDAAWSALCAELEATVSGVAARFAQAENAHLSFTEVHDLAQLVDLAEDGLPLDLRLVDFATQCLVQVAERAARTRFRPNYFSEYKCLDALWEEASAHRKHNPSTVQYEAEAHPAS